MSTLAEIESAIEKLPPEKIYALRDWIVGRAEVAKGRKWKPEELTEGARQMVEEPDPAKAQVIWESTVAGFYGYADA